MASSGETTRSPLQVWIANVVRTVKTVISGMFVTGRYWLRTYRRGTFTEIYEYPEKPIPVASRYRGFHRYDLTTCIACDQCAKACPVDCIFMGASHDLSCYSRDGCMVAFSRLPVSVGWGRSSLNPTAVAQSKVIVDPVHGGPNQ